MNENQDGNKDVYLTTGDANFEYLFGGAGRGIATTRPLGGTSVVIEGLAGTGKTILACQLCAVSLRDRLPQKDRGIIYTLDQSPDDLIRLIEQFGWMSPSEITEVDYGEIIAPGRSRARLFIKAVPQEQQTVGDLWRRVVADGPRPSEPHRDGSVVRIIVIDSINAVLRRGMDELGYETQFRRLVKDVHEFGGIAILTLEKLAPDLPQVEEYVPNCVIELNRGSGSAQSRTMETKKARNQKHFIGTHDFTIVAEEDDAATQADSGVEKGVRVYPSLEARSAGIGTAGVSSEGMPGELFGYAPIDNEIEGGLQKGSATLLWGVPGTHKTDLCAKFLAEGLPKDDPESLALFITFKIERAAFLRFLREEAVRSGRGPDELENRTDIIAARDPFELPTSVLTKIMKTVETRGRKIKRAGVFGLRRLHQLPAYKDQHWGFLEVLVRFLHSYDITTLLIDWPDPGAVAVPMVIDLCANEIEMKKDSETDVITALIKRCDYALVGKRVTYE